MSNAVDFYYDYGSPTAYLAWTQLAKICAAQGAQLNAKPMLLGGVFKATGNSTPVTIEAKGKWLFQDVQRYADYYEVPFAMNPHFIVNTISAMRGAVWAQAANCLETYDKALFEATWVRGINTGDTDQLAQVLRDADLDADAMLAAIQTPDVKQGLISATEEAVARGVFGAPSMFVNDTLHFGQDRLQWIERTLQAG